MTTRNLYTHPISTDEMVAAVERALGEHEAALRRLSHPPEGDLHGHALRAAVERLKGLQ